MGRLGLLIAIVFVCLSSRVHCSNERTVILVSFDGFRWDYLYRGHSLNLERIAARGARVMQLMNAFPTKTFPNHYSLVTGLFPESHGIVGNDMYDPMLKKHFEVGDLDPAWWDEAEPAWVTLRKRGLVTATVNWPGSDAKIRGVRPTYWHPYYLNLTYEARVDKAISWLQQKEGRPNFICLYFDEPDFTGHMFGPNGEETLRAVKRVDGVAGYLMRRLHDIGQRDSVNVIFTSDHGMVEGSPKREIYLEDYVSPSSYELVDMSPLAQILPNAGRESEVYDKLHNAHPNLTVYHKEDVPTRMHFTHNRRIMPILALADLGWSIYPNRSVAASLRKRAWGSHGYDNGDPGVHPYFVATGPAFRKSFKMPIMNSVDVYPLVFKLLGEKPLACNGTLDVPSRLLRSLPSPAATSKPKQVASPIAAPADTAASRKQQTVAILLSVGGIALAAGALMMTSL